MPHVSKRCGDTLLPHNRHVLSCRTIQAARRCQVLYYAPLRSAKTVAKGLTPACFNVAGTLVSALTVQMELEPKNVDQDIEEMVDLCDELLKSGISTDSLIHLIMEFMRAVRVRLREPFDGKVPSEQVIGCTQKAVTTYLPDSHEVSLRALCLLDVS